MCKSGAAESGAVAESGVFWSDCDPALRLLIEVWGELPDGVKNQVLRMVNEAVYEAR